MAEISTEVAEKFLNDFLEALELDVSDLDKEIEITTDDGVVRSNPFANGKKFAVMMIQKGRLRLDAERIAATYTFKKPLVGHDKTLNDISLSVDGLTTRKVEIVQKAKEADAKKGTDLARWDGICLLSPLAPKQLLGEMTVREAALMEFLEQLFFAY